MPIQLRSVEPGMLDCLAQNLRYTKYHRFLSSSYRSEKIAGISSIRIEYRVKGIETALACLEKASEVDMSLFSFYSIEPLLMKRYRYILLQHLNQAFMNVRN